MEDGQNLGCIAAEFGSDHSSHLKKKSEDYYLAQIKNLRNSTRFQSALKEKNQRLHHYYVQYDNPGCGVSGLGIQNQKPITCDAITFMIIAKTLFTC